VEEVAGILGKREGAIKALQHRAMAALRRHLTRDPAPV
jgi:DNA-directed RNA polymerase specialized sigma24 family protein